MSMPPYGVLAMGFCAIDVVYRVVFQNSSLYDWVVSASMLLGYSAFSIVRSLVWPSDWQQNSRKLHVITHSFLAALSLLCFPLGFNQITPTVAAIWVALVVVIGTGGVLHYKRFSGVHRMEQIVNLVFVAMFHDFLTSTPASVYRIHWSHILPTLVFQMVNLGLLSFGGMSELDGDDSFVPGQASYLSSSVLSVFVVVPYLLHLFFGWNVTILCLISLCCTMATVAWAPISFYGKGPVDARLKEVTFDSHMRSQAIDEILKGRHQIGSPCTKDDLVADKYYAYPLKMHSWRAWFTHTFLVRDPLFHSTSKPGVYQCELRHLWKWGLPDVASRDVLSLEYKGVIIHGCGWDVSSLNLLEIQGIDDDDAVYFLHTTSQEDVFVWSDKPFL